ncbi:MAG: dTDP-4-dehydrorhamnose 3,5-epimerase [Proteobacteria bacterium]|nr:dTDP-4-dehydrorhamnose 3,5-epimerase [Pseudomonadota bacterium]
MIFTRTKIAGVVVIDIEPVADARGHFARWYCRQEFAAHGLDELGAQGAVSRNVKRGTLRGLHFIAEDVGEAKLVRCAKGACFDVAVDMRHGSPTYGAWHGVTLDDDGHRALYIPRGCAHGFLTLSDATDVIYQFSDPHRPGVERGVRWDDPDLAIDWPIGVDIISDRDRNLPSFRSLSPETAVDR